MNNPAEEIVSCWAQFCKKQFVMMNIRYQYTSNKGKSVTREIDILAIEPSNSFVDYEVKWRTTSWINATESETIDGIAEQLNNKYRNRMIADIVEKYTGAKSSHIGKVLVTPMKHFGKKSLEQRIINLKKKGIEIEWFETILSDLIRYIETSPNKGQFDSIALGTIRIIRELQNELES